MDSQFCNLTLVYAFTIILKLLKKNLYRGTNEIIDLNLQPVKAFVLSYLIVGFNSLMN